MASNHDSATYDFLGAFTALICAVHCSIVPILASFSLVGATGHHNHTFDIVLLAIGVVIAGYVLVRDYIRIHQCLIPGTVCIIGFLLLTTGIVTHYSPLLLNIPGGILIAFSHYLNYKHSKKAELQSA